MHPDRRIEVVNAGVGAALSGSIAAYGRQVLTLDPDLLVLYFGYNDLTHLPAVADLLAYEGWRMELRSVLDRLRTVALLRRLLPKRQADTGGPGAYRDPTPDGGEDRLLALAERNARDHMAGLARAAAEVGVDVLIGIQAQSGALCHVDPTSENDCLQSSLRRIALGAGAAAEVAVIDLPAALVEHAGGVAGHDYFWDSIHPSRLGQAVIGETLAPVVSDLLMAR
jgi:lysophospholipase L1-like esterase